MTALSRLRDAERALATDPAHDSAARHAIRAARERAGVPAPPYWLVVPGGRDGRGRLHLLRPIARDWMQVGAVTHGVTQMRPRWPGLACSPGYPLRRAYPAPNEPTPRWADLSPGSPPRERLCRRCDRACGGGAPVDNARLDAMDDMLRWQLAWAAARGLPYPVDGADAERVPELLAEVERELAAAGRFVVLPGSATRLAVTVPWDAPLGVGVGLGRCACGAPAVVESGVLGEGPAVPRCGECARALEESVAESRGGAP